MGHFRRTIRTVDVEMHETSEEGVYLLRVYGRPLLRLTFSHNDGHGRWSCPCGSYQSGKRDSVLAHVVEGHVLHAGRSLEARNTYLRLAGKYPDPTYDEAVYHLYGSRW